MKICKYKLKDFEFANLKNLSNKERTEWLKPRLGDCILIGYGFYGIGALVEEDDEHYITYYTGETCD